MTRRGLRLGAVLVPLGVALIPVSVLMWYGAVRIPTQEAYLNERNLRLLTTLGGPIKAKIESFDGAIDHAVQSFRPGGHADLHTFRQGVHLFARDLDVRDLALDEAPTVKRPTRSVPAVGIEAKMLASADDPPRVQVERDEGRYYLYVGAKLDDGRKRTLRIVARSDLEAIVAPFLDAGQEFAAILLTTDKGEVIVQKSPVGLTLARLDGVINSRLSTGVAKDSNVPSFQFESLSTFSNMMQVTIGEVAYKLYMQPVSLSLLSIKDSDRGARNAEQWVLCGLVRADRFRAESSSLSYTALLLFSGFLAIFALAIPFVKLRVLGARERLRASDVGWVTATTFVAIGLLTIGSLDVLACGWRLEHAVDDRLRAVADALARNVRFELAAIDRQATTFESSLDQTFANVSRYLDAHDQRSPRIVVANGDGEPPALSCLPKPACSVALLESAGRPGQPQIDRWDYPFFDLATWAGEDGWQRVRWTPGPGIRPFLNIFEEKLAYGPMARAAWRTPDAAPTKGVSVVSSPNTGEPVTVFWRTSKNARPKWVQSLAAANLVSLDRPILPRGVSFAVVDMDGQVLFHSVRSHRLRENLLKEVEDDPRLRALVLNGETGALSARYLGRPNRFYVAPLTFAELALRGGDPGWRLAVFQDSAIVDTVNLEMLTLACWLFAGYAGVLAITAALIYGLSSQQPAKWFWPDAGKSSAYRAAAGLNAAVTVIFVVMFSGVGRLQSPGALLGITAALAVAAAVATYRVVARAKPTLPTARAFSVWHPFFIARSTFLVVVAVLPAIACFQVAYEFETTLLAKSESVQAAHDTRDLSSRIAKAVEPFRRSNRAEDFERIRRAFVSAETYASLWPGSQRAEAAAVGESRLGRTLIWMHRRYNNTAIDLASAGGIAATVQTPAQVLNAAWLVTIVGLLFVSCHVFVYWLVRPIFVVDAVAPPVFGARRGEALPEHVLVCGPPGSGKSTKLAADPKIRVFDIATLAYVERRRKTASVPFERRRAVGAPAGAPAGFQWDWSDTPPSAQTPPPPPTVSSVGWADAASDVALPDALGIDHLDYRLDEREFAAQTLRFLERAIYRGGATIVRIASDRDPLAYLRDSDIPASELDRWVRALRSFRKEMVGIGRRADLFQFDTSRDPDNVSTRASSQVKRAILDECRGIPRLVAIANVILPTFHQSTTVYDALKAFGTAASPFYAALWNACTADERLTLHQIAAEGVVNPQNDAVVRDLMRAGLVVRDRTVQILNQTFRDFALQAPSADQVSTWERRGVTIPWGSIELAMMTVVVVLAALLVVTQERLLNAWVGFLPTLVPAAQRLWKTFAALRPATKDGAAA